MLRNVVISTIMQFIIFITLPFLYYVIKNKGIKGFWSWIGLKAAPAMDTRTIVIVALITILYLAMTPLLITIGDLEVGGIVFDSYYSKGFSIEFILILLIWAGLQTSLTEELFFRGFLRQVFFKNKNWIYGNIIQSIVFGAIHVLGYLNFSPLIMFIIFIYSGGMAYLFGWIVEKKSNGSILYTWGLHALVNIISVPLGIFFIK